MQRHKCLSRVSLVAFGVPTLLAAASLLSGCQPLGLPARGFIPPPPPATPALPTLVHNPEIVDDPDLLHFLEELEQHGIRPQSVDDSQNELLRPAPGLGYQLDSGWLHVHVYPSLADAHQRAQQVPTELAQSIADWVGTPHFFECGRLLGLYFGDDVAVLAALGEICGANAP